MTDHYQLLVIGGGSGGLAHAQRAAEYGKYVSVSVSFQADSREQLDAIYDTLTAHDKVLMRL